MKKRSLILSVLLTIAMVFTMMPAMVFADDVDTNAYYVEDTDVTSTEDLVMDADYLIVVGEGATVDGLTSDTNQEQVIFNNNKTEFSVEEKLGSKVIVDSNNTSSAVWTWNGTTFTQTKGNRRLDLYFSSQGIKFQNSNPRAMTWENKKLYATSGTDGSISGARYYLTENESGFGTICDRTQPEDVDPPAPEIAANVRFFRRAYVVTFDFAGIGGNNYQEFSKCGNGGVGPYFIEKPEDPTDANNVFEGWLYEGVEVFEYTDVMGVSENMTLTASWTYHGAAIDEAKKEAVDQMNSTDLSKYKAEQQAAIKSAIADAAAKVNSASTMEGVNAALKDFNAFVTAQPTASDINYLAKVSLKNKKVKAGKKKLQIKWKAKATNFDGYEVWYKAKGKGKSWNCVQVASPTAAKKTIKGLKKGKKYTAKVRGYKLYGLNKEVKVFGKFSKSKTVKVK